VHLERFALATQASLGLRAPAVVVHVEERVGDLTRELPAPLEATAANFTGSPMWNPRRTLKDAEYQASFALWPCACLHTPPRQTVTRFARLTRSTLSTVTREIAQPMQMCTDESPRLTGGRFDTGNLRQASSAGGPVPCALRTRRARRHARADDVCDVLRTR
jgi:hypothetical protein